MELKYILTVKEEVKEFATEVNSASARTSNVVEFSINETAYQISCNYRVKDGEDEFLKAITEYSFGKEEASKLELYVGDTKLIELSEPTISVSTTIENGKIVKQLQITQYK